MSPILCILSLTELQSDNKITQSKYSFLPPIDILFHFFHTFYIHDILQIRDFNVSQQPSSQPCFWVPPAPTALARLTPAPWATSSRHPGFHQYQCSLIILPNRYLYQPSSGFHRYQTNTSQYYQYQPVYTCLASSFNQYLPTSKFILRAQLSWKLIQHAAILLLVNSP